MVDVIYHLTVEPQTVAQLVVPTSPPARSSSDSTAPLPAPSGTVLSMFLFLPENILDVGDSDTLALPEGKGVINFGNATISCHVHGKVDLVPPTSTSSNGIRVFTAT